MVIENVRLGLILYAFMGIRVYLKESSPIDSRIRTNWKTTYKISIEKLFFLIIKIDLIKLPLVVDNINDLVGVVLMTAPTQYNLA